MEITTYATGIIYCQKDFSTLAQVVFSVLKIPPKHGLGTTEMQKPQPLLSFLKRKETFPAQEKSHLITADVKPLQVLVQVHDLVNHGFDQCQGLLLVRVQGVGQRLHLPQMSKLPVLQHKLQGKGELRAAATPGDSSVV